MPRTLDELPSPPGLPFLGNLHQVDLKKLHQIIGQWCDELGSIYTFRLGGKKIVVVSDVESIQTILKQRPTKYRRLNAIETVFAEMGLHGVFSAEGDDWKRQRRMIAHAMDSSHLRQFFPTLVKVTERLKNRWARAAETGEDVDIQKDFTRYTVDVTSNLAFGYDMNTLETEGDVIQEHLEIVFPMINSRVNAPIPYWRFFKLPADRRLDESLAHIREAVKGFLARARERMAANPDLAEHPTNLIEAMLAARDEGNAAFTDQEIYANVITVLLGGEDTTANTLAWALFFMMDYPEAQKRMQAEARSLVGPGGLASDVEALDKLDYIEAVASETLRLKPVAPILFLEAIEDVEVAGAAIPKGMPIFLAMMHPGQADAHFGGAKQFRPERWMEVKEAAAAGCPHNAKAMFPFGGGPRFCPGRQLAMVEIKTVLAMLCANFEVTKPSVPLPVKEVFAFTMMPEGLRVRFRKVQD